MYSLPNWVTIRYYVPAAIKRKGRSMRKLASLFAAVMLFAGVSAFAADVTPVKLSLFPMLGIPPAQIVHGLDLGLIATKVDEVKGWQAGWIYAGTRDNMVGLQTGFVTSAKKVTGLQYGFVNLADNATGVMLGFVNVADNMKGVQIGLVNVIKSGPVPAMVLINANF